MATYSSVLAWRIPGTGEPGGLQSMESRRVNTTERLHFHFSLSCIGEGNSNPLQCSCLENPRDGGAWWAAVYGVALSRTRLKRLSSSSCSSFHSNLKTHDPASPPRSITRRSCHLRGHSPTRRRAASGVNREEPWGESKAVGTR